MDPRLLRQDIPARDPALGHRDGKRWHSSDKPLPIEPVAGCPLPCPPFGLGPQRLEAGGRGQVDPAAPPEAVVDPRLGTELGRPLPMEPVAPGRERGMRVGFDGNRCRWQNTGRGPRRGLPPRFPRQQPHTATTPGEFPGDRETDDSSADDAAVDDHEGGFSRSKLGWST